MRKTVWIIDHYSSEPQYGGISRQYDFAKELGKAGHKIVVISSSFSHFIHQYLSDKDVFESEVNKNVYYIYLKTTEYQKNNGIGRFKNMLSFWYQVKKYTGYIAKKYGNPDAVEGCSVHPFAWIAAYQISRKYHCRFCAEVRDFWPGIWVWGKEKSKFDPMVIFFAALERWTYRNADRVIYSMRYGDRYICDVLGIPREKAFLIGQPMDCERFDRNREEKKELIPMNIRDFIKDSFVCVFAGYYMKYEGVYTMLEAAKRLREKGILIKMVFVGSGQEEDGMKQYVKEHELTNVMMGGRIPKEVVPALLSQCDICMAHLEVKGHQEVYKYGVSKNKIIEYLYSGACTLYGFSDSRDAVEESGAGYIFTPFSSKELADDIEKIYQMTSDERKQFGINGRNYIKQYHSVQVLGKRLEKILLEN